MTSDNQTDKKFVRKGNIDTLVTVPIIFSMLLLIGWAYFGEKILLGEVPQKYNYIVLGISAFIFGLSGLSQIITRSAPGPFGKNKTFSVIGGVLWLTICWIASIILIISSHFQP